MEFEASMSPQLRRVSSHLNNSLVYKLERLEKGMGPALVK